MGNILKKSNNDTPKPFSSRPSWLLIFLTGMFLYFTFWGTNSNTEEIGWLQFESTMLAKRDVEKVVVINKEKAEIYIKEDRLSSPEYKEVSEALWGTNLGPHYTMSIGSVESFETKMTEAQTNLSAGSKVNITYKSRVQWLTVLAWIFPLAMIYFLWMFIMNPMGRGSTSGRSSLFNFGKSTAKLIEKDTRSKVTFEEVAGLHEAKLEVKEIIDFLKNPTYYTKLGAKIPKGVMLVGPPGTGKTLMARAVAGEAQVPFFSLSGSEFIEMFVGVGASRVRDLFKQAKAKAPSIIFIDEIDSIGRARGKVNAFQSNDERESTLNQLLAELDGFGTNTGVIVMAATNRADILDKALLRPGRFDRHIYLELPNKEERKEIFQVHIKNLVISKDVDIDLLASLSPGFSGADIANICNEAALIAARKQKDLVDHEDFLAARDRIVGGLERKSKIISPKEKEIVAYHEAGHAVVSWYLEHVDPLLKVSIIPRGKALGAAWYLPEEHQIMTKAQLTDRLCAALGGRAAEEVVFNEISSGALDDLEKVTKQAYNMVAFYGLDEEFGPMSFYDSSGDYQRFMGKPYSDHTARVIDKEVQNLIFDCYAKTKNLLYDHRKELEELAQLLLKKEVAEFEDLKKILGSRIPDSIEV